MDEHRSRRDLLRQALPVAVAGVAGCSLGSSETATPTESATIPAVGTPSVETLAKQVREVAIPLGTTDPSASLSPMAPLADVFDDARIVAMGESTHGTREFFRLKHRLLRFLVEELDYRVFAWEAHFSETLAVDEYVRTGTGDPVEALDIVDYWTWDTASVLAMIEWLRSFNEGRDPTDKVRFYGFDVLSVSGPARRVRSYLERVDREALDRYGSALTRIAEKGLSDENGIVQERLETVERLVTDIGALLEENRQSYVEASSTDAFALAKRHLWTMDRARAHRTADQPIEQFRIRDRAMAANVTWLLEYEGADAIALWAHNGHVAAQSYAGEPPMGYHLREEFGDAYYPLGFEFGHGRFRASSREDGERRTFSVGEPPRRSIPGVLSESGLSPFALDFTSLSEQPLAEWLYQIHYFHVVTASASQGLGPEGYNWSINPRVLFDGLVFVEESTPTRHPGRDAPPTPK